LSSDGSAFHGIDGLGGLYAKGHRLPDGDWLAEDRIVEWAKTDTQGAERWLLCTGPLTNVASALMKAPALPDLISRVVVMGGAFGDPPGNITPWAEFNFHADPTAASVICASRFRLDLIPLDVTERVEFRQSDLEGLNDSFSGKLLLASIAYTHHAIGLEGCYMHDAIAAMAMVRPELVVTHEVELTVDSVGEFAGRVAEHSAPSLMRRAIQIDVDETRQSLIELLERGL
jgi:purine nucleosidase